MAARPPAAGPVRGTRQLAPAGPVSGVAGGAPVGAGEPRPVLDHPDRYSAGGTPAALAHTKWLAILAHAKWLAISWGIDDAPASLSAPLLALAPFQPVEKYQ